MNYSVDRIEEDIVILQNINTKDIKEVSIHKLDFKVKESDILVYKNNKYYKDDNLKQKRLKSLQDKLNVAKNI